jgi:PPM family protein phosphatase
MRHPRRNEVYRDVGSDAHEPADHDFISVTHVEFPADASLLICSDGLTDLVTADAIRQIVRAHAGHPDDVAGALIDAANAAGGKDNVTVVYAEGHGFAATTGGRAAGTPLGFLHGAVLALLLVLTALAVWQIGWPDRGPVARFLGVSPAHAIVVRSNESIAAAIDRAPAGHVVLVEPGEYRERLVLKSNVRVASRVARGATIRLPGSAAEGDAAVTASGVTGAELTGFRIVGDAATPLGTGVVTRNAGVRLVDLDISGAAIAALDLGPGAGSELTGSDIHDNPGAAIVARAGAATRIAHSVFAKNGSSERARGAFVVESQAEPRWLRNVFQGVEPPVFVGLDDARRQALAAENWFVKLHPGGTVAPASPGARNGRAGPGRR